MAEEDEPLGLDLLSDDDRRAYLNPPLSIKVVAFLFIAEVAYSYSQHKLLPHIVRLDWVFFSHTGALPNQSTRRGVRIVSNDSSEPNLSVNDALVRFPRSHQLGQSKDQQITFATAKVTPDQLEAFLKDVPPSNWTIQALLDFVKDNQATAD